MAVVLVSTEFVSCRNPWRDVIKDIMTVNCAQFLTFENFPFFSMNQSSYASHVNNYEQLPRSASTPTAPLDARRMSKCGVSGRDDRIFKETSRRTKRTSQPLLRLTDCSLHQMQLNNFLLISVARFLIHSQNSGIFAMHVQSKTFNW